MANGYGALTLADMLRQGVPEEALRTRQEGLADALRTAPARRPPKPTKPYPQELFDQPPENIPEQYLTDPFFASAYHAYQGTPATPSSSAAELLGTTPEHESARPWFADVSPDQIPEEMLTDPDFASAYNAWHGTEATPGDPEETGEAPEMEASEDETTEDAPLMVQGGPQEDRAPGVYPVQDQPGMVDVVLGGGAGGRMSEDEFYGSKELTDQVRAAMAPQRDAAELASMPVAAGQSEAVATAPGETTVYLPPDAQEPAGGVEVAVGQPQIRRRVAREARAAPMSPEQQAAALEAVRSGREATRALATGPVLRREAPSTAVADGKGNGAAAQVADIVKTAAPAVKQAMDENLITPEGLRLLTVLTRDPTLMRIGEIVAGEAASERQLKSKEALAKQAAADKAAAAKDLAEYRKGMVGAATKRADAAMKNALKARGGAGGLTPVQKAHLERAQAMDEYRQLKDLSQATDKALFSDALDALQTMEGLVPGVTFGEAPKAIPATGLGERLLAGVGLRGWMGPKEAEARQALENLRDVVKRARSGAAISASEEKNYLGMLGDQALASPQAMATALSQFRRTFGQRLAGLQSPAPPQVLAKYKGPKAADFLERPPAKARGTTPAGKVRMQGPGGETGLVDATEAAEAEANGWKRL